MKTKFNEVEIGGSFIAFGRQMLKDGNHTATTIEDKQQFIFNGNEWVKSYWQLADPKVLDNVQPMKEPIGTIFNMKLKKVYNRPDFFKQHYMLAVTFKDDPKTNTLYYDVKLNDTIVKTSTLNNTSLSNLKGLNLFITVDGKETEITLLQRKEVNGWDISINSGAESVAVFCKENKTIFHYFTI